MYRYGWMAIDGEEVTLSKGQRVGGMEGVMIASTVEQIKAVDIFRDIC